MRPGALDECGRRQLGWRLVGPLQRLAPTLPLGDVLIAVNPIALRANPALRRIAEAYGLGVGRAVERAPGHTTIPRRHQRRTLSWNQPSVHRLGVGAPGDSPPQGGTHEMERADRRVRLAKLVPGPPAIVGPEQAAGSHRPPGGDADEVDADEFFR